MKIKVILWNCKFILKGENYYTIFYPDRGEMYEADLITFYYN